MLQMLSEEADKVLASGRPKSIITYSGQRFYYDLLEDTRQIDIEDIAHGLSQICRFTGQCEEFYSVAQHSVYVSLLVPKRYSLAGLLHDAAEAYCNDLSSPLKPYVKAYVDIEEKLMQTIYKKFGVVYNEDVKKEIKAADKQLCRTEQRDLLPYYKNNPERRTELLPVYNFKVKPVPPKEAKDRFLYSFQELTK